MFDLDFPLFRWVEAEKKLWNPVLKKAYINRPEERVRLALVDAILERELWSKNLMGFEIDASHRAQLGLRSDIVLYDRNHKAQVLIECKAAGVFINQAVALQSLRYNEKLGAQAIMLTNGTDHILLEKKESWEQVKALTQLPSLNSPIEIKYDWAYWQKHGFVGEEVVSEFKEGFLEFIQACYKQNTHKVHWIDFPEAPNALPMASYYYVYDLQKEEGPRSSLSLSVLAGPKENTYMVGVLTLKGQNAALLILDLNQWFKESTTKATLWSQKASIMLDVSAELSSIFGQEKIELNSSFNTLYEVIKKNI